MSLESNGVDGCVLYDKFRRDLVAQTFATVAHFALSVVTQPNSPKCTERVRNAPKHKVRVQWGGSNGLL